MVLIVMEVCINFICLKIVSFVFYPYFTNLTKISFVLEPKQKKRKTEITPYIETLDGK